MILGVDPGRAGALALVEPLPGYRPRFIRAWPVWGSDAAWWRRLDEALLAARELAEGHAISVMVELPGGQGATHHKVYGPGTWLSMGRQLGRVESACRHIWPSVRIHDIDSGQWPRELRLLVGKQGDGWHRLREAQTLCSGFVVSLPDTQAERDRQVACAEAVLIACAGAFRAATRCAQG